jgi:cytochrome c
VVVRVVKPLLGRTLLVIATIEISASLFIHPFGDIRNTATRQGTVLQNAQPPLAVIETLNNSCLNCHSENTVWPWYSRVAPISWVIERDVSRARNKMNLSRWEENSPEEKIAILTRIRAAARSKVMPPPQYTLIHPEAKLSAAQIQELYAWARPRAVGSARRAITKTGIGIRCDELSGNVSQQRRTSCGPSYESARPPAVPIRP